MTEFKGTPGEWSVNEWSKNHVPGISSLGANDKGFKEYRGDAVNESHFQIVSDAQPMEHNVTGDFQGANIATVPYFVHQDGGKESVANARLIAAAPDLLKALRNLLNEKKLEAQSLTIDTEAEKEAVVALRKALGE